MNSTTSEVEKQIIHAVPYLYRDMWAIVARWNSPNNTPDVQVGHVISTKHVLLHYVSKVVDVSHLATDENNQNFLR